jgi:hypothetical protein
MFASTFNNWRIHLVKQSFHLNQFTRPTKAVKCCGPRGFNFVGKKKRTVKFASFCDFTHFSDRDVLC